jgi:capsular exopolysaccharide synthesis family protein
MEMKGEDLKIKGETLRTLVENAVRKALDGQEKIVPDGLVPPSVMASSYEPYAESGEEGEAPSGKEQAPSLRWYQEINSIAVNIKIKIGEGKKGTIVFTSSVSGEGTTTLCVNVARALAKISAGNILLIDFNLQKPKIHKIFRTHPAPGLMDVLTGKTGWEEGIRKSNVKNFHILPHGQSLLESLGLIGSGATEQLLNTLKPHYDFILIDTPPILSSAEAEMLSNFVEAVILVIKAHSTRREVVVRAAERIYKQKEFLGAILNQREFKIPQFIYKRLK